MNRTVVAVVSLLTIILGLAAFSHRILPATADECQRDVTHAGHIADLPLFHCIGHSETSPETGAWDHVHPWMTEEWHLEHDSEDKLRSAQD